MSKKLAIISLASLILAISISIIFYLKSSKLEKNSNTLEDQVKSLKEQLKYKENQILELESELSKVHHFDEEGSIINGDISNDDNSFSFTGDYIRTQIEGEFEGWDGDTIFKMMNGSVWQQSEYSYTYHYAYMPDVILFKKNGLYYMKVEDVDEIISVQQLR